MLLKELTNEDMQIMTCYRDYYAPTSNGEEPINERQASMSHVLRYWNRNKVDLFRLLGNKLMVSKEVTIKAPVEEQECSMRKMCYSSDFFNWYISLVNDNYFSNVYTMEQRRALLNLMGEKDLVSNKFSCHLKESITLPDGKSITISHGCRPMRTLSKFAKAHGKDKEFEEFRLKHSQILNTKTVQGELVLSIHPMDFMTMSDNDCNWSSCMSWTNEGCYRQGTVEMMNSNCVVVAYLKSKQDMRIGSYYWSNKKWRELIIVDESLISNVKAYPYKNPECSKMAIEMLAELAKANLNWEYEDEMVEYSPSSNFTTNSGKQLCLTFETDYMYNDLTCSDITCYAKLNPGLPQGEHHTYYSGENECIWCGSRYPYFNSEEDLTCTDCSEPWGYCEECGKPISEEDAWEIDGVHVCQCCYDDYSVYTKDDNDYHLYNNVYRIYLLKDGSTFSLGRCNDIWVADPFSEDFMSKYVTIDALRCDTSSYGSYYLYESDLTPEGVEFFN